MTSFFPLPYAAINSEDPVAMAALFERLDRVNGTVDKLGDPVILPDPTQPLLGLQLRALRKNAAIPGAYEIIDTFTPQYSVDNKSPMIAPARRMDGAALEEMGPHYMEYLAENFSPKQREQLRIEVVPCSGVRTAPNKEAIGVKRVCYTWIATVPASDGGAVTIAPEFAATLERERAEYFRAMHKQAAARNNQAPTLSERVAQLEAKVAYLDGSSPDGVVRPAVTDTRSSRDERPPLRPRVSLHRPANGGLKPRR